MGVNIDLGEHFFDTFLSVWIPSQNSLPVPQIPREDPTSARTTESLNELCPMGTRIVWFRGSHVTQASLIRMSLSPVLGLSGLKMDFFPAGHCKESIQQKHMTSTTSEPHPYPQNPVFDENIIVLD